MLMDELLGNTKELEERHYAEYIMRVEGYKNEMADMIAKQEGIKYKNPKAKNKVIKRFLAGLSNEEVMVHFSRVTGAERDEAMRLHIADALLAAGLIDTNGLPSKFGKYIKAFTTRGSRSQHEQSSGLVITPIGQLILAVAQVNKQNELLSAYMFDQRFTQRLK